MRFAMERVAEGRYEVRVEVFGALTRAGIVLGGGRRWTAEASAGDFLGMYATRAQAARVVADDAVDPLWIGMKGRAMSLGLPRHYAGDLGVDRRTLRQWLPCKGRVSFLWLLRAGGTNLVPLNLEWSRREAASTLSAFEAEFVRNEGPRARAFVLQPGRREPLTEVSFSRAKRLLAIEPEYRIDNQRRALIGPAGTIASFDVMGRGEQLATVAVHPSPQADDGMEPLLRSAAAGFFAHYFGSFFGPRSNQVEIVWPHMKAA